MAKFNFYDGAIVSDLSALANLSKEERLSIIRPAAGLLIDAYSEKIKSLFKQWTGSLADSFMPTEIASSSETIIYISPKGKHPRSNKGKRKKNKLSTKRSKKNAASTGVRVRRDKDSDSIASKARNKTTGLITGQYYSTNAEVAYILEFGSPRISATHWMERTNEEQVDAILSSEEAEWDSLLKKKGL